MVDAQKLLPDILGMDLASLSLFVGQLDCLSITSCCANTRRRGAYRSRRSDRHVLEVTTARAARERIPGRRERAKSKVE
jgi:hypothetical protein